MIDRMGELDTVEIFIQESTPRAARVPGTAVFMTTWKPASRMRCCNLKAQQGAAQAHHASSTVQIAERTFVRPSV
jgi:hypothetical protein